MTTLAETASINIKHERVENKIAGIMMFNNIFSSGGHASPKVVGWIYQFVPVELVIQMVQSENSEKSIAIQSAALNFLVYSCESTSVARSLLSFVGKLCDVFVKTKRTEFKSQLSTFLKLLALVNGSKGKAKIIDALLEATLNEKSTDSLPVLSLLVEVASTPNSIIESVESSKINKKATSSDHTTHVLSVAHSAVVRSLVVQGLHGAAPQTTRDATFLCVKQLLTWLLDPTDSTGVRVLYEISPFWTWSVQDAASATFPMFLCSILRSELQLLCDELQFLATNSAETVAERFNLTISAKATVPSSMAPGANTTNNTEGNNSNSEGRDGATSDKKDEVDTNTAESVPPVDPAVALQRKIDADIAYFQSRVTRTHAMYLTCLQLLDCVLNLLIGEKETVTESRWSTLPGESLLGIKKVIYSMLNDLFEFLIDCAERLKDIESETKGTFGDNSSNRTGSFTAAASLRSVACCTLDTMSRFLEQDNELMEVFVKCVPKLLPISHVRRGGEVSEVSAGVTMECVVQALAGYVNSGNSMEDNKHRWTELLSYDPLASSFTVTTISAAGADSTSTDTFNAFHCELYLHLVEPVRTLIYLGNSNDLFPNTYDALVDCVPLLLPQLVGLLHFIFDRVRSSIRNRGDVSGGRKDSYNQQSLVSAALSLMWLLQDLLTIQKGKHLSEIKLLMQGGGPSVVTSMLGVETSALVEFSQTLRLLAAQLREQQNTWLVGATEREVGETGALVVVSLEVAETIAELFSDHPALEREACCQVL